jgi:4-hydroxybenzoate polyprenyltransferase
VARNWRVYFELLRFPAAFTAIADVMMGFLVTQGTLRPAFAFALLVATSSSIYWAGMVLNDVFDLEIDRLERPHRPIPSGRIHLRSAAKLGWILLIGGIIFAVAASLLIGRWLPAIAAGLLAACVVLYDVVLKSTLFAPLAMGGCRFLNVLLGMSLATESRSPFRGSWDPTEIAIALGVGIYITGVTWFARGEARNPSRPRLLAGMGTMLVGLLWLEQAGYVKMRPADSFTESVNWPLLWFAIATVIFGRCLWAVWKLEPGATQIAVRSSIRAIVLIDAALVVGFCGPAWGWAVLALLVPMLLLERWASTT